VRRLRWFGPTQIAFISLASACAIHAESLNEPVTRFPSLRLGAAVNPSVLTGSDAAYANTP